MKLTNRRGLLAAAALMLSLFPGASPAEAAKRRSGVNAASEVWVRTELYFGTNKANGEVTDAEFSAFMDSTVSPLFPDGLTLLTGYGQFKDSGGVLIRERSHLLILLYPPQTPDANKKIQDIRQLYKTTFGQESVLRVDSFALVSF